MLLKLALRYIVRRIKNDYMYRSYWSLSLANYFREELEKASFADLKSNKRVIANMAADHFLNDLIQCESNLK